MLKNFLHELDYAKGTFEYEKDTTQGFENVNTGDIKVHSVKYDYENSVSEFMKNEEKFNSTITALKQMLYGDPRYDYDEGIVTRNMVPEIEKGQSRYDIMYDKRGQ